MFELSILSQTLDFVKVSRFPIGDILMFTSYETMLPSCLHVAFLADGARLVIFRTLTSPYFPSS